MRLFCERTFRWAGELACGSSVNDFSERSVFGLIMSLNAYDCWLCSGAHVSDGVTVLTGVSVGLCRALASRRRLLAAGAFFLPQ